MDTNSNFRSNYLGIPMSPRMAQCYYKDFLPPPRSAHNAMKKCNLAQAIMLIEEKIIPSCYSHKLLAALVEIDQVTFEEFPYNSLHGDLYYIHEEIVSQKAESAAGWLHIGRSRIDISAAVIRMTAREGILQTLMALGLLKDLLLNIAINETTTIMPGYTHLQHAQPVTLAHYLLGHVDALYRDSERLAQAYKRVNCCPLGTAATAGTSWPINRHRLKELLGFSELIDNSRDAGQNFDSLLEASYAFSILMNTLSRLATDLYIWSSHEFGFFTLDDAYSGNSSIMPQKKNPCPFEIVRVRSFETSSLANLLWSIHHNFTSGFPEFIYIAPSLIDKVSLNACKMIDLMNGALDTGKFNRVEMSSKVNSTCSAAVELANLLCRDKNISFDSAHHIVACYLNKAKKLNITTSQDGAELLNRVSYEELEIVINITAAELRQALDPDNFVRAQTTEGGTSPELVRIAINKRKEELRHYNNEVTLLNEKISKANLAQIKAINELLNDR